MEKSLRVVFAFTQNYHVDGELSIRALFRSQAFAMELSQDPESIRDPLVEAQALKQVADAIKQAMHETRVEISGAKEAAWSEKSIEGLVPVGVAMKAPKNNGEASDPFILVRGPQTLPAFEIQEAHAWGEQFRIALERSFGSPALDFEIAAESASSSRMTFRTSETELVVDSMSGLSNQLSVAPGVFHAVMDAAFSHPAFLAAREAIELKKIAQGAINPDAFAPPAVSRSPRAL